MSEGQLAKGDLVWAKVLGHPWWPGTFVRYERRRGVVESLALVNFIGDRSHASLPLKMVVPYEEKYEELSRTRRKDLADSIRLADSLRLNLASVKQHPLVGKRPLKDRRVVGSDSEDEKSPSRNGNGSLNHTADSGPALRDAAKLLEKLVNSQDINVVLIQHQDVLHALELISDLADSHGLVMQTGVGIALNKFVIAYDKANVLHDLLAVAKRSLGRIVAIVNTAYFGSPTIASTTASEPQPEATLSPLKPAPYILLSPPLRRLKHAQSTSESGGEAPAPTPAQTQEARTETKSATVSCPAEEEKKGAEVDQGAVEELDPAKNSALMISVCQELAKLIEEVFVRMWIRGRKRR